VSNEQSADAGGHPSNWRFQRLRFLAAPGMLEKIAGAVEVCLTSLLQELDGDFGSRHAKGMHREKLVDDPVVLCGRVGTSWRCLRYTNT
jgi:hypothetical protein